MRKGFVRKLGVWSLAVGLFALHLFFRNVAHAEETVGWRPAFTKRGECQISFPTSPELIEQSIQVSEQGDLLHYDIYVAPLETKGAMLLLIATYPHPIPDGQEKVGLEGLIRGILGQNPQNELIFAKAMKFMGQFSVDFLIQSETSYFRGRAFMLKDKLFLIAMEGNKGALNEKLFGKFLGTFQLLTRASKN